MPNNNSPAQIIPPIDTRVVIVGGGIAGVWLALKLAKSQISSVLITYQGRDRGGLQGSTIRSVGAINTQILRRKDYYRYLHGLGIGQNHPSIARVTKANIAQEVAELEYYAAFKPIKIGVALADEDTRALIGNLYQDYRVHGGIVVNGWVTRLAAGARHCAGVQYQTENGIGKIRAPVLVMACGGYAGLFEGSINTHNYGAVLGHYLRAGGIAQNLEFVFKHGYGKPDVGELTPTEELPGAEVIDQDGEHVHWLERELYSGEGTKNHLQTLRFWQANYNRAYYVELKYRPLYLAVREFNNSVNSLQDDRGASAAQDKLLALLRPAMRENIGSRLQHIRARQSCLSFEEFCEMKSCLHIEPQSQRFKVRQIAYFSMGGAAHNCFATNLHNVFVTGEAMHDFGANRVGGLPWGLYLAAAPVIRDQIVACLAQEDSLQRSDDFATVDATARFDTELLRQIRLRLYHAQESLCNKASILESVSWCREQRRQLQVQGGCLDDAAGWLSVGEAILASSLVRVESRGCFLRKDYAAENELLGNLFTQVRYDSGKDIMIAQLVDYSDIDSRHGYLLAEGYKMADKVGRSNNAVEFFIERHIKSGAGGQVALYERGRPPLDYAGLSDRINKIGNYLLSISVKKEQRVALLFPDCREFVACFFAVIKIGAVAIPLNAYADEELIDYFVKNSGAVILLSHESLHAAVAQLKYNATTTLQHVVVFNENLIAGQSNVLESCPVSNDDSAFWLYTSGSTGRPKGVVHRHRSMVECAHNYGQDVLGILPADICYSTSKLFFAYGLGNSILFPFSVAASSILNQERADAASIVENVELFKPTLFFSVPTIYNKLLLEVKINQATLAGVRMCISAGEYLPTLIFEKWRECTGQTIYDGIGTTEAMHIFCTNKIGMVRAGTSGVPVAGYEIRLVDENDQPVGAGEVGRLMVKGATLAKGYWNRYEETQRAFAGEWLVTGDLYYCNDEGFYVYVGREGDTFKSAGLWVSPAEIEQVLLSHEAVYEAAVISTQNEVGLYVPKAYIVVNMEVTDMDCARFEEHIFKYLKERLSSYKLPQEIEIVEQLPKTATGKIARFRLKTMRGNPSELEVTA